MKENSFQKMHELSMKGVEYFHYIMDGSKPFEGRVNGLKCRAMNVGDHLKMVDAAAGWGIICKIVSKDVYSDFKSMLRDKGVLAMLPQLKEQAETLSDQQLVEAGVSIYKAFPGSHKAQDRGVVAIGVEFIQKV
jgi:ASC-1-like (ASCH) protein